MDLKSGHPKEWTKVMFSDSKVAVIATLECLR
jgi:hypothetical protein